VAQGQVRPLGNRVLLDQFPAVADRQQWAIIQIGATLLL